MTRSTGRQHAHPNDRYPHHSGPTNSVPNVWFTTSGVVEALAVASPVTRYFGGIPFLDLSELESISPIIIFEQSTSLSL
jgi:hypothetical protein